MPCLTDPGNDEMSPAVVLACSRLVLPDRARPALSQITTVQGDAEGSFASLVLPTWCSEILGMPVTPFEAVNPTESVIAPSIKTTDLSTQQAAPSIKATNNKTRLGCSCKRCQHCTYSRQLSRTVCARCRDKRCKCHVCGQTRRKVDHGTACACTNAITNPKRIAKLCSNALYPGGEVERIIKPDLAAPICSSFLTTLPGLFSPDVGVSFDNINFNWEDC